MTVIAGPSSTKKNESTHEGMAATNLMSAGASFTRKDGVQSELRSTKSYETTLYAWGWRFVLLRWQCNSPDYSTRIGMTDLPA